MKIKSIIYFFIASLAVVLISCHKEEVIELKPIGAISISITNANNTKVTFPDIFGASLKIDVVEGNGFEDSVKFVSQPSGVHRTQDYVEVPIEKRFIIIINTEISGTPLSGTSDTILLENGFPSPLDIELFLSTGSIIMSITGAAVTGSTSAVVTGTFDDHGGDKSTEFGFIWGKADDPEFGDVDISYNIIGTEMGSYSHVLSSLDPNTTYYARAFARNESETVYSNSIDFLTNAPPTPVSLATGSINILGPTSVEVNGMILDDGGNTIVQKGVVYDTNTEPDLANCLAFTNEGSGSMDFISIITGLSPSTTYKIRTYSITEIEDTAYSATIEFSTPAATVPVLGTAGTTEVRPYSASFQSSISADGGYPVTAKGVVFGTTTAPDLSNNVGYTDEGPGIGDFQSQITNLLPATTYFARTYATNELGTSYSNEVSFITTTIGDIGPGGGIIFYLNGTDGGLEVGNVDTEVSLQWGCASTATNATATAIGEGIGNTFTIVDFHDALPDYYGNPTQCDINNDGSVAAKYCNDFSQTVSMTGTCLLQTS
jgi:hypothetical protein